MKEPNFITIEDFCANEEISDVKHEYLGGTVHAMAGANHQHHRIATSALLSLGAQLRGKPCEPLNSDTKVRIEFPDDTRFYDPDAMVVCERKSGTEHHSGLGGVIPLPEIEADLPLAELYERVKLDA